MTMRRTGLAALAQALLAMAALVSAAEGPRETEGLAAYARGDFDATITLLSVSVDAHRGSAKARAFLVRAYMEKALMSAKQKNYGATLEQLAAARQLSPSDAAIGGLYQWALHARSADQAPQNAPSNYSIQPQDILSITVYGQPDMATRARVSAAGTITFPILGEVRLSGMTVQKAEQALKSGLEKGYLVNAQVMVFVEEYHARRISILGEVQKPGNYDIPQERDFALLEAVALAGGFTKRADTSAVRVIRLANGRKSTLLANVKHIMADGENDMRLQAGDVVIVSESLF